MSQQSLSDFVKRCRETMDEYSRLRFLGVSHDMALIQSGFRDAVMGKQIDHGAQLRDVRRIVAGDRE